MMIMMGNDNDNVVNDESVIKIGNDDKRDDGSDDDDANDDFFYMFRYV